MLHSIEVKLYPKVKPSFLSCFKFMFKPFLCVLGILLVVLLASAVAQAKSNYYAGVGAGSTLAGKDLIDITLGRNITPNFSIEVNANGEIVPTQNKDIPFKFKGIRVFN